MLINVIDTVDTRLVTRIAFITHEYEMVNTAHAFKTTHSLPSIL